MQRPLLNQPRLSTSEGSVPFTKSRGFRDWCCWRTRRRACGSCCFVFVIIVVASIVHAYLNNFWFKTPDISLVSIETVAFQAVAGKSLTMTLNLTLGLNNSNSVGLTAHWAKAAAWKDDPVHQASYHLADGESNGAVAIRPNAFVKIPIQVKVDYKDVATINAVLQAILDDCPNFLGNTSIRINLWGEAHVVIDVVTPEIPIKVRIPCSPTP